MLLLLSTPSGDLLLYLYPWLVRAFVKAAQLLPCVLTSSSSSSPGAANKSCCCCCCRNLNNKQEWQQAH
jgi:hypothetical protein